MKHRIHRNWLKLGLFALAASSSLALATLTMAASSRSQDPNEAPASVQAVARADLTPEERVDRISGAMNRLVRGGRATSIVWSEDGSSVAFNCGRDRYRYEFATKALSPAPEESEPAGNDGPRGADRGAARLRGRQRERTTSPDGKWVAVCENWNIIIESASEPTDSSDRKPLHLTTNGDRKFSYGKAGWVYGEELDQDDAMWWSPDSSMLAFYECDERNIPDHFIASGLLDPHTQEMVASYPKPGEPNPVMNLLVYDVAAKSMTRVDPPTPSEGEWYTYDIRWSPDGKQLLFNRTNRRQDVLNVVAADPATGKTRIVVTEKQETWQSNAPTMKFLEDGVRFIWETEKNGWKNYELRNLDGSLIATLTSNQYPVAGITRIDEKNGVLYYTAFSEPSCPLNAQLHRVNLDGSGEKRLTADPLNHTTIELSPDAKWFIATSEAVDAMPTTSLYSGEGGIVKTLCESDRTSFDDWELPMPELFKFKADDGQTDVFGVLYRPSDFDPTKKYPLVIDAYGGPESQGVRNRFTAANPSCEYGFLIAKIDNRGTINRGKAFESATYLRLGEKDLQDQVDGVKYLAQRPYVDASRVGIFGHSYGGYMSALAILQYPDVFQVAVAGAPVTDWRNYDSIYTERYMRTPIENADGYDVGSCLKYAEQLRGHLLIVHGMLDDNVHANNTWQLVDLLQKADKPFDMMLYPTYNHGVRGNYNSVRWRYLREHLLNQN